jgi:signal transduction histidine kinase
LKNNLLRKKSLFIRTDPLLTDGHRYRPLVDDTKATPKFEFDRENSDSVKQQFLESWQKERDMNQAKSLLVTVISHKMRTPLAIRQRAVELIEHDNDKLSDGDRSNYVQSKRAILQMTQTMDAVLILGTVQNNQLSFQPLKVDMVLFCTKN